MSSDIPMLNFTPVGSWPDGSPVEPAQGGVGAVLVTQWDKLAGTSEPPGAPHQVRRINGERTVSVVVYHPKLHAHKVVTRELQVVLKEVVLKGDTPPAFGRSGWSYYSRHHVQYQVGWTPQLPIKVEGQPWEDTIDTATRNVMTYAVQKQMEARHGWRDEPIRMWWLAYTPGRQRLNVNELHMDRDRHWYRLNDQIGKVLTRPCNHQGPPGHLAVIRNLEAHRTWGQYIQSPLAAVDAAHPPVLVEEDYSLHLLCQDRLCADRVKGEAIWPVRSVTDPSTANMLYGMLAAKGVNLEGLWLDAVNATSGFGKHSWKQSRYDQVIRDADKTLGQILSKTRVTKPLAC